MQNLERGATLIIKNGYTVIKIEVIELTEKTILFKHLDYKNSEPTRMMLDDFNFKYRFVEYIENFNDKLTKELSNKK
jgi:butyrate kinase